MKDAVSNLFIVQPSVCTFEYIIELPKVFNAINHTDMEQV